MAKSDAVAVAAPGGAWKEAKRAFRFLTQKESSPAPPPRKAV